MLIHFFYKFHPFLFPDGSREAHPNFKKKRHFSIFSNENPNSSKGQVEGGLHLKT